MVWKIAFSFKEHCVNIVSRIFRWNHGEVCHWRQDKYDLMHGEILRRVSLVYHLFRPNYKVFISLFKNIYLEAFNIFYDLTFHNLLTALPSPHFSHSYDWCPKGFKKSNFIEDPVKDAERTAQLKCLNSTQPPLFFILLVNFLTHGCFFDGSVQDHTKGS